jgi:hypothetical protein
MLILYHSHPQKDAVFMGTESEFCATLARFPSLFARRMFATPASGNPTSLKPAKLDQAFAKAKDCSLFTAPSKRGWAQREEDWDLLSKVGTPART